MDLQKIHDTGFVTASSVHGNAQYFKKNPERSRVTKIMMREESREPNQMNDGIRQ